MAWKATLEQGQNIVLATSSKGGSPRAIIVVSLGFIDDRLLIGACLMRKSLENIKENNKVSIATFKDNKYYRIDGVAAIYSTGKYLDTAIKKSKPPLPKVAILIDIKEVFDLDRGIKML